MTNSRRSAPGAAEHEDHHSPASASANRAITPRCNPVEPDGPVLSLAEPADALDSELLVLNTQLRSSLEKQRAATQLLEAVLNSHDIATLLLDNELNIRLFTPATRAVFNIIDSDIGRPLADLCPLASDANLLDDAKAVMRDRLPREREVESRSGASFTRRISVHSYQDIFIEGVIITFTNIGERKVLALTLDNAATQAINAAAERSRFLAMASHDLRQPLQTLKLLQGLLLGTLHDEHARQLTRRIGETVGAISGMLSALTDINDIRSHAVHATSVSFRLSDVMERLADAFSYQAAARGVTLKVVPCRLFVQSDPKLLEQLLRNLLSSTLVCANRGRMLLGCRRHSHHLRIELWDTGLGHEAVAPGAYFNDRTPPSFNADECREAPALSLSVAQELSHLLGHNLRIRPQWGKAPVFALEVPVSSERVGLACAVQQTLKRGDVALAKNGLLLIVEDDAELLKLLGGVLKMQGFKVAMARDGAAALACIAHGGVRPDLILADFNLPGAINGLQVVMELRSKLHVRIPAIILTGNISRQTARDVEFEHCTQLNKPAKLDEITRAIASLISAEPIYELQQPANEILPAEGVEVSTIFLIDGDDLMRDSIRGVLESGGYRVQDYVSCEVFIETYQPGQLACLLVDAHLPGMSGFELISGLRQNGDSLPMVIASSSSDVAHAVGAMKAGAADFIEKPLGRSELLQSVCRALHHSRDASERLASDQQAAKNIAALTPRQRQIMDMVLAGQPSKNIASDLGISQRTVENHRAAIMSRTHCKSIPALARAAFAAQHEPF